MTNANVETVEDVAVQNVLGRVLLLKYKGGKIKVLVPADTLVVKRVIADSSGFYAADRPLSSLWILDFL